MGVFVLVELLLEEGRNAGTLISYDAKFLEILEDGQLNLKFLCMKSAFTKNIFTFLTIEDVALVEPRQIKGVLVTYKGIAKIQSHLVKVSPPHFHFNMYF